MDVKLRSVICLADARRAAFNVLLKTEKGEFPNKLLASELDTTDKRDVRFATRLVYGVVEKQLTIDFVIGKFLKGSLKKVSPYVRTALRMGVYQILYMDSVPDSAACNESVNLIKRKEHRGSISLVNAVLRNICRQRDTIDVENFSNEKFESKDEFLSVKYSFPAWLIKRWRKQREDADVEAWLAGMNVSDSFWIRANEIVTDGKNLKERLIGLGYTVADEKDSFLLVENPSGLVDGELFADGEFYVQNPSSGLPAVYLNPQENEKILDMCAAPGGKTTHVAALVNNKCEITACDVSDEKIALIEENCRRLKIDCVETKVLDGTVYVPSFDRKFDAVLADVPCSGTGTISGKPEIKWRLKESDFDELSKIQSNILENAAAYVREGGRLIYSTCSIDKAENTDVVAEFLEKHPEFYACDENGNRLSLEEAELQVFPSKDNGGSDGFYVVRLRKDK